MLENFDKKSRRLFYSLIILEILIVVLLSFKKHDNVSFKTESYYSLNDGWSYEDDDGNTNLIQLPAQLAAGPDNSIVIKRWLPVEINHLNTISMYTSHQNIYVYLDNELIYTKIDNPDRGYFNIPAMNIRTIIPIPTGSAGRLLTIAISSEYNEMAGKLQDIYAGTRSSLLIQLLNSSSLSLVIAIITFTDGLLIILIYLFLKRLLTINRAFVFLGWFSILAAVWMIMESNLTQVFMNNEYVISALNYLSLITLPIPIIHYITYFDNYHYKKCLYIISHIFSGSAILYILLQWFNILNFHDLEYFIQLEIILLSTIVLLTLILEIICYRNKEIKIFCTAAGILFGFGIAEYLNEYYLTTIDRGQFFQFGFLIFIIILSWDKLNKVAYVIKLSESAKHYKFLATRDLLTNCRNRVSYVHDMDHVSLDRSITIFVADMNNMKQVNDTYGHHIGDEALILCSNCLLKVFGHRVYRIGGDEFVCIQYDLTQEKINAMLMAFEEECKIVNEDIPYSFQMSIGYAVFDELHDRTIYDTVKRADKNMYEQKNHGKKV